MKTDVYVYIYMYNVFSVQIKFKL